ncbi:hypothetical protein [Enterobacter hormaechei]|uniref:hypothetical protein n=1 Tax=Enterobacter hormaechei TaxID=158836 RepID=UPI0033567F8B
MSTITRERIEQLANGNNICKVTREERIELARIALASLEAEAVAWLLSGGGAKNNVSFDSGNAYADPLREVTPLYTAPPAPVSVPEAYVRDERGRMMLNGRQEPRIGYGAGWNGYRAAMLQGAELVTAANKLPEGWVAVPVEPTEDMIVNGFESEPDESFSDEKEWEVYEAMSGCQQAAHRAKLCWAAMIEAAPKLKHDLT